MIIDCLCININKSKVGKKNCHVNRELYIPLTFSKSLDILS